MRHLLQPHVGARPDSTSAIAHWKLDEASGNAVDALAGYDLTANGSPGLAASLFATPSGSTGARTFNGTSQFFQDFVNDATLASQVANEGAVSAVFNPDSVTGKRSIFTYEGTSVSAVQFENKIFCIYTNGTEILVEWEHGSGNLVSSQTTGAGLSTGNSYLVVAAWSGATTKTLRIYLFRQGAGLVHEESFSGLTGADGGSNSDLQIGRGRDDTTYFDGTMDDVVLWSYPLTRDAALLLYGETFGISYDEDTIYDSDNGVYHLRVRIEDSGGTLRDLTNLAHSQDLVLSADVSDDIDQPGATATVSVVREVDSWSLAHDVQSSPLNLLTGSYSALVDLNARILIDTAVIPQGMTPNDWDWVPLFDGFISSVDWGADQITIQAGDKIGPLFETFIAREPLQIQAIDDSGAGNTVVITTVTIHGLSAGDQIKIYDTTNYNGRWTVAEILATDQFRTVQATAGGVASETSGFVFENDQRPYGDAAGVPVQDVIQEIIDDNEPAPYTGGSPYGYVGGTPTVYTPVDPAFDIRPFYQKREPVQTAIETLAAMIGWNIKYRWHDTARDFRLTLFEPDRSKTTPDYTFSNNEILEVTRASIEGRDIRNAVEVIYSDFNDADENNFAPRASVVRSDATSISKYGYRYCQIAEGSTSQIDSYSEASDLADAILADLKEPKADISIDIPFRRFVDTGDLYRLPADGYHWDSTKDVAVTGYSHSFSDGQARTSLTLRGQPASMNKGWQIRFVMPGLAPNQPTTPPIDTTTSPTLTPFPGGAEVFQDIPNDLRARNFDTTEIHVSQTSGFIPDSTTYKQIARANRSPILNLDPAQTHYIRTQFRDKFGNVSRWSDQGTVTPTYMLSIPAARAYRSGSYQDLGFALNVPVTDQVIQFNAEAFDRRNNYDTGNYWWECPVDGIYQIDAMVSVEFNSANQNNSGAIQVYRANNTPSVVLQGATYTEIQHTVISNCDIEGIIEASAGDRLQIRITTNGKGSKTSFGAANASTTYVSFTLVSQD